MTPEAKLTRLSGASPGSAIKTQVLQVAMAPAGIALWNSGSVCGPASALPTDAGSSSTVQPARRIHAAWNEIMTLSGTPQGARAPDSRGSRRGSKGRARA